MTWQRDDPGLYEKEKAEVEAHFPELRFVVENDLVYVRGSFAVMFEAQVLDRSAKPMAWRRCSIPQHWSSPSTPICRAK